MEMRRFPFRDSGTSPDAIFCAKPSTMAVFPTPAGPTRSGLFLSAKSFRQHCES